MTAARSETVRLEPFGPAHIPEAVALSAEAGWPHRAEDWALTLGVSTGVAAMSGARLVGTALCSGFGGVAALNMIIVAGALRGRGLGRRLMEATIALAEGRELRLTATAEGMPLYEKLGFAPVGRILQHQGPARAGAPEKPVRTGGEEDIAAFAAADLAASGMARAALLARIAAAGEVLTTEGGFAMLRPFGRGHVVGPVVARDAAAARALIAEAARRRAGGFLRVDLPETAGLSDFAETLGLAHAGGGVAMVRDARAAAPRDFTTFALAAQALG